MDLTRFNQDMPSSNCMDTRKVNSQNKIVPRGLKYSSRNLTIMVPSIPPPRISPISTLP